MDDTRMYFLKASECHLPICCTCSWVTRLRIAVVAEPILKLWDFMDDVSIPECTTHRFSWCIKKYLVIGWLLIMNSGPEDDPHRDSNFERQVASPTACPLGGIARCNGTELLLCLYLVKLTVTTDVSGDIDMWFLVSKLGFCSDSFRPLDCLLWRFWPAHCIEVRFCNICNCIIYMTLTFT